MAEICVDCWNKQHSDDDAARRYTLSKELDLCEECGQYKHVVVRIKKWARLQEWWQDVKEYHRFRKELKP